MTPVSGQPVSTTLSPGTVKECAICGTAEEVTLLFRTPCFDVVICRLCGFAYVNERIPEAQRGEGIPELLQATCLAEAASFQSRFRKSLARIEEFVPQRGKILDVGCGEGYFLRVARDSGWDVTGLDLDKSRVEAAARQGISVEWATLDEADLGQEQFDVVTLFHVIEHVNNPLQSLKKIWSALKPRGLLVVETPTNDFFLVKLMELLYRLSGGRWSSPVTYFYTSTGQWGHQYRHCRRSLSLLLRKAGFEILKIDLAEDAPFRLFLRQRNYGKSRVISLVNSLRLAPIFAIMQLPGMDSRMVMYGLKEAIPPPGP